MNKNDAMIGVFDSGVGGLTVLRALVDALPGEHTVYLGDTARVPYGTKSAAVVTRYALNVVEHLQRYPLKALVVACNTASAVALPALRARLQLPVLGVVDPGAAAALARGGRRVAVLATEGTVRSGAYERALQLRQAEVEIVARPCPLFVPLAEEGLCEGPIVDAICHHYLDELAGRVDTAILGCTHYPLLGPAIARALGPGVQVIDGGAATAAALAELLADRDLRAERGDGAEHRFLFTDAPERTAAVCARFFGRPIERLEEIDL